MAELKKFGPEDLLVCGQCGDVVPKIMADLHPCVTNLVNNPEYEELDLSGESQETEEVDESMRTAARFVFGILLLQLLLQTITLLVTIFK